MATRQVSERGHGHEYAGPVSRRGGAADDDEATDTAHGRCDQWSRNDGWGVVGLHLPAQHSVAKVLCICADDFGLRGGVNEAILALLDAGRIQAVSCMVGGKAWLEGAQALRNRDRRCFDAGLHLDLTDSPLLPGSRHHLSHLIVASMTQMIHREALRREIDAQLDAFEAGLGCAPAYVDGHQHVHQLSLVREALLAALTDRYGEVLPWLRSTRTVRGAAWTSPKALLIEYLGGGALMAMAVRQGFQHNARLLGVYDFRGGEARYRALLGEWLQAARSGDLMMCHPGTGSDDFDRIAAARHAEFTVLADPLFAIHLRPGELMLLPMSRWLAGTIG
jgi:predicted glycoside hydrolase/deacetylase ChbG (UPF0249 family)